MDLAHNKGSIQNQYRVVADTAGAVQSEVGLHRAGYGSTDSAPSSPPSSPTATEPPIRTYKWRWVVLTLFSTISSITNYIWIMSAIIGDVIKCYYGVNDTYLNFLSTSFMMMYVVLVWPVSWILGRYGLRLPVVIASVATALGACIRVIGTGMLAST